MKQENIAIYARVAAFWQLVFQTLPNLDVHPGVAVYHTFKIFSIVNAKDLLMPHTKFQVCTLQLNTIFCHRKNKIPLLLNRNVHVSRCTHHLVVPLYCEMVGLELKWNENIEHKSHIQSWGNCLAISCCAIQCRVFCGTMHNDETPLCSIYTVGHGWGIFCFGDIN